MGQEEVAMDPYATICDLPYEMLQEVLALLCIEDIISLARTCRALYYPVARDELVWRRFCVPFGVDDTAPYNGRDFRTLYTRWLHKYGSLIGLWASDHPFKGSIVEFRIARNQWTPSEVPIIVGEAWCMTRAVQWEPGQPRYVEFVQIGFNLEDSPTGGDPDLASVTWRIDPSLVLANRARAEHPFLPEKASRRPPILRLVSSRRSLSVTRGRLHIAHPTLPDFPSNTTHAWYDACRALPRLRVEHACDPDGMRAHNSLRGWNVMSTSTRPTEAWSVTSEDIPVERPALCMYPMPWWDHAWPLVAPPHEVYPAALDSPPRFYPLRGCIQRGVDPAAPDWSPQTLEGLWLGDYGPHKTECLYLEYRVGQYQLYAWKVTGDINVPRGAWSWMIKLQDELDARDLGPLFPVELGTEHGSVRAFEGEGTISESIFDNLIQIPVVVFLMGADRIKVRWGPDNFANAYFRYQGRGQQ
ncbi:hypothetical protein CERSUDRAFT_99282 [Gelatoporia subvermispora B]|uniref:F-box domain-containing protein n=1 Tax=Ceriporiopsis subvermispora (strain B) TaxID=914234 RepID=M2Q6U7_CERS8|nr:hypothetical protein CERSUDRAFT_99282 [Gelatoporia subvermispora B]